MAVIDSNNLIIHLVWSGLVDELTCGELKKAIELCTIKEDVYTKADIVTMLRELQQEMEENVLVNDSNVLMPFLQARETCVAVIQQKINALKGNASGNGS